MKGKQQPALLELGVLLDQNRRNQFRFERRRLKVRKWAVSIRSSKKSYMFLFQGEDPESSGAKEFAKAKKQQLEGKRVVVEIISRTKHYAPPRKAMEELDTNNLWCPYCARVRHFFWDGQYDVQRCPVCGITTREYNVRWYNPQADLWTKEKMTRRRKSRRKTPRAS